MPCAGSSTRRSHRWAAPTAWHWPRWLGSPSSTPSSFDVATGIEGLFATAIARGLPFAPTVGAWSDIPGPVRDQLAALAPVDAAVLRRAADAYVARGETQVALDVLVDAGDPAAAA